MSSKKVKRWIDVNNRKSSLKISQRYYIAKESGSHFRLLSKQVLIPLLKRLFFLIFNLFRRFTDRSKGMRKPFLKKLLGLFEFEKVDILPEPSTLIPILFPSEPNPEVSIIISVHNHLSYTYRCLQSILLNTADQSYEVIIVNDFSIDKSAEFLSTLPNITYIENTKNIGFLKSCNKAAEVARGKYLCFLNNDTQVSPHWLKNMVTVFSNDEMTGIVGAKLIYPYGLLQEAGGLINYKGQPAHYGKFQDPEHNQYNFIRETDYCSGACILINRSDFELLGGFDDRYAPAYYEDTDLCLSVKYKLGKKNYYQPLSEVIHFEGISSGKVIKTGNMKEYQRINAEKFSSKWCHVFNTFPKSEDTDAIASKFNTGKTILFIDSFLPEHDKNSGSRRIFELLKIFKALKYNVFFLAHDGKREEPYYSELINMGVRIIYPVISFRFPFAELKEILDQLDFVWISRPEINAIYAPIIQEKKSIIWIYDTVDLHFIREERRFNLQKVVTHDDKKELAAIKVAEVRFAKHAQLTVAITETEKKILAALGAKNVEVIPNIHFPYKGPLKSFEDRAGLCFIGGFHHQPNVDAVLYLINDIMPYVWKKYPHIKVTILGSNPGPEIVALESSNIEITGYVPDVSQYFNSSRVFVAPLRFGAGMKGKIGQSLEYGLPIVTSAIGAEGMDLEHNYNILLAESAQDFASEIIRIYNNRVLWEQISVNSLLAIEKYSPANIAEEIKSIFASFD
jgi:GT2 family glycosyltransferase